MHTREELEAVLDRLLRKKFCQPADEHGEEIIAELDAEIIEYETVLVLDVEAYVTCVEHEQETASILVREEWWSIVRSALYKELGMNVEAKQLRIHW